MMIEDYGQGPMGEGMGEKITNEAPEPDQEAPEAEKSAEVEPEAEAAEEETEAEVA